MKDHLQQMTAVFKALGEARRLQIIKLLASHMADSLCVSDVAERLGISQPAASQHIRVLKTIGILNENRRGYRVFYAINNSVLSVYKAQVDELFRKAFEKCPHNFSCGECPYGRSCGPPKKRSRGKKENRSAKRRDP